MFVPISENVFVPAHRIERISFWSEMAQVKYIDQREPDVLKGQDAMRLRHAVCGAPAPEENKKGSRKC